VLVGVGMFASFMLTPLLLQRSTETGHGFGVSVMVAGLCMAPMGLGMLLFSPLSAKLSARRGAQATLLTGALLLAVGNVAQALLPGNLALLMAVLMVLSVGAALCFSAMPTLIMAWVPVTETASANSLNSLLRTIGTSTCAAVGGTLLAAYPTRVDGSVVPATTGFQVTFWVAAAASVGAAGLALAVTAVIRGSARTTAEDAVAARAVAAQ
jgi:MFS family permease